MLLRPTIFMAWFWRVYTRVIRAARFSASWFTCWSFSLVTALFRVIFELACFHCMVVVVTKCRMCPIESFIVAHMRAPELETVEINSLVYHCSDVSISLAVAVGWTLWLFIRDAGGKVCPGRRIVWQTNLANGKKQMMRYRTTGSFGELIVFLENVNAQLKLAVCKKHSISHCRLQAKTVFPLKSRKTVVANHYICRVFSKCVLGWMV